MSERFQNLLEKS